MYLPPYVTDETKPYIRKNNGRVTIIEDADVFGELRDRGLEFFQQTFWSKANIATAATNVPFFTVAVNDTTLSITNMEAAGQFPEPQLFFARAIGFELEPLTSLVNAQNILATGVLTITIAGKWRFREKLSDIPGGGGVVSPTTTTANNGEGNINNLLWLPHWLRFQTLQNFQCNLTFDAPGVTIAAGPAVGNVKMFGMWGRQPA